MSLPKERLLRFVVGREREVVFDVEGRLPGRGFWLSARRDVVETVRARNLFVKAARAKVDAPADLALRVERALLSRCLDLLERAGRAGAVVAGDEAVRRWLAEGRVGLLLAARDAGGGGCWLTERAPGVHEVRLFSDEELGKALGLRPPLGRVAVAAGRLAGRLVEEAGRLAGFREANGKRRE